MFILLSGSLESFLQLIGVLIIFLFVLVITWLTTRWMGNYQKGRSHNKNLRVIETIGVGSNKMISIVAAGKKYLIVSIGKEEVHLLAELAEEELYDLSAADQGGEHSSESFSEILDRFRERFPKKRD